MNIYFSLWCSVSVWVVAVVALHVIRCDLEVSPHLSAFL